MQVSKRGAALVAPSTRLSLFLSFHLPQNFVPSHAFLETMTLLLQQQWRVLRGQEGCPLWMLFFFFFFALASSASCSPPRVSYYGVRKTGFLYKCVHRLGSKQGITPPCAQLCPLNMTWRFPFAFNGLMHVTAAEPNKRDPETRYRIVMLGSNCSHVSLQAMWFGPSLTIYAGFQAETPIGQSFHDLCDATTDPMPCKCTH